jgi:hypothetical protein
MLFTWEGGGDFIPKRWNTVQEEIPKRRELARRRLKKARHGKIPEIGQTRHSPLHHTSFTVTAICTLPTLEAMERVEGDGDQRPSTTSTRVPPRLLCGKKMTMTMRRIQTA